MIIALSAALILSLALTPRPVLGQILEQPVLPLSLKQVPIPPVPNLDNYVRNEAAARLLGKALFWDMQLGSDGVTACASCHFHAGADNRSRNQGAPGPGAAFNHMAPNKQTVAADFPFMKLAQPDNRLSTRTFETNDIFGSQGVFKADFTAFDPAIPGDAVDQGVLQPDTTFHVGVTGTTQTSVRQVTGRNSPSVIMAAYNVHNFWDGRANKNFNGLNPFGEGGEPASPFRIQRDADRQGPGGWAVETVNLEWASAASQAVGPPLSDVEMSWAGRDFRQIGRKMLQLTPLAKQMVSKTDSILGPSSKAPLKGVQAINGDPITYLELVQEAFRQEFWDSDVTSGTPENYTLAENNFSLFFGLAIMMYERTLVPDDSKFDRFLEGKANLSALEQKGLEIFFDRDRFNGMEGNPLGGRCHVCHLGAEFTSISAAGILALAAAENTLPIFTEFMPMKDNLPRHYDLGFYNLAIRPSEEDRGRGGSDPLGRHLSTSRRTFINFLPAFETFIAAEGHFKTPSLRNVELTGPYMHTGGFSTLMQVVDLYARGGDFPEHVIPLNNRITTGEMSPAIGSDQPLGNIAVLVNNEENQNALVAFLLTLTDERVKYERAPFDRPQLLVPNGEPTDEFGTIVQCTDQQKLTGTCSHMLDLPAVGADGRSRTNPLRPFLNLDPFSPDVGLQRSPMSGMTHEIVYPLLLK